MIMFKSCPRCSGDQSLEEDYYGWYVLCLMCGHVAYPKVAEEPRQRQRSEIAQHAAAEAGGSLKNWAEKYVESMSGAGS
jgi:hypothetical protein